MTELKNMTSIKDEELNEVTGGYSGHVDKYHGVIGETYYFVNDRYKDSYIKGVLLESWERNYLWWTERMHKIMVIETNYSKGKRGDIATIHGDQHTMYLYK